MCTWFQACVEKFTIVVPLFSELSKWHTILNHWFQSILFLEGVLHFTSQKCEKLRIYPWQPDPDNAGVGKLKKEFEGPLHKGLFFFGNILDRLIQLHLNSFVNWFLCTWRHTSRTAASLNSIHASVTTPRFVVSQLVDGSCLIFFRSARPAREWYPQRKHCDIWLIM